MLNALLASVRTRGGIALAVASSGIAATLLRNGRTAHSRFKIPIKLHEASKSSIRLGGPLAELIRKARLIIWDEVVMQHRLAIECVDRTFREILNIDELFGGKTVVFAGDFRQILPVVPLGNRAEIVSACIKSSYIWPHVTELTLSENVRVRSDSPNYNLFLNFMMQVGEGRLPILKRNGMEGIEVPYFLRGMISSASNIDEFIDQIYPNLESENFDEKDYDKTAILAPRNDEVDLLNSKIIQKFRKNDEENKLKTYLSADSIEDDLNSMILPNEVLNSITPSGLPPHKLELKKYAIVILLRNINPRKGLCNGTRMRILQLRETIILCTIISGKFEGTNVIVPRIPLTSTDERYPPFTRVQFPIKLAFAMTINRGQGQSFGRVGGYLVYHVFSHGQLYVALSRVTDPSNCLLF